MVEEYFRDRHWDMVSLEAAVRRGCALEESTGLRFTWLTCTNAGAAEVCRAAWGVAGIDADELSMGVSLRSWVEVSSSDTCPTRYQGAIDSQL